MQVSMALGLCVRRHAAGTVRRADIVLRRAIPAASAASSACRVAKGTPHMRLALHVGNQLRRGELLGGTIMQSHATQCLWCIICERGRGCHV